ncbi:related to SH3 domain [Lecanosticta acicola]|uniref:Related to SH3 domain n=1 Tax=Lecanosticta acicola TaxID=111012 RepID=A0AAI8YVU7_9PEZI|nr:related to SH3 domain [Lecanosticta acicola]
MAQSCISLANSASCPAFNASSISTDSSLTALFPFLSSVGDVASFDSGIRDYIAQNFTQSRYQTLIGCSNVNLDNTTAFYARYTTSVLCNAIVQNSIQPCALTGDAATPLCAETCAEYAQSEQEIAASNVCGTTNSNALQQIRADFTNCALPANSITGTCIQGYQNQQTECGFSTNLGGLCSYCASSSPNSTDSCCVFSNTTERCQGVTLPIVASSSLAAVTMTASASPTSSTTGAGASNNNGGNGLSKGAIAGIVIGSVLGALLLLALLIFACTFWRRRRDHSPATSIFNQPSAGRGTPQMSYSDGARDHQEAAGLALGSGGRVARMAALEGSSSSDHAMPYAIGYAKDGSEEVDSPERRLAPPPKRSGSLSSGSQLGVAMGDNLDTSPSSNAEYTSPESQGQSEQLDFFKDYYSQDEIRQGDLVATLWAYEPRAADEFQLERGDMVKVLGIWDDGWATGVRVRQRADDWRPEDRVLRDSGLSAKPPAEDNDEGEVKAFPLVCVCLPQHWAKTIEGDSTEGSRPGGYPDRS